MSIKQFVIDCVKEYGEEPDNIEVKVDVKYQNVRVSISKYDSPFYYSKSADLEDIGVTGSEVVEWI